MITYPKDVNCFLWYLFAKVIYDGNGTIIKWVMVTDGSVLTDDITTSGQHDVIFLKTATGRLTSTVIKNTMITLKRYICLHSSIDVDEQVDEEVI